VKGMSYKKFAIIILCVLYACLGSLALINIVVDPYAIFGTPFLKNQSQVNDRYAKIEFLRKGKKRYNSYIMGSSRILNLYPDIIEKYFREGKFYNLATTLATPYEHLLHLKYFIKNGYLVKNLYIGLDIDFCFTAKMHKDKDLLLRLHPKVSNKNLIVFYWSYLSVFPKADIRRKLRANFSKRVGPKFIYGKDGALALGPEVENRYVFFDGLANRNNMVIKNEMEEENVEGLRELVALCRQHEINLILFITPLNKSLMDRFVVEDYLIFLRKLSEVTSFWDFSGYNSISTNNRNYTDSSHYKSSVSRLIAARIFNDRTLTVPSDFGVWVTKENIGWHLTNLRMSFKKNRDGNETLNLRTQTKAEEQFLKSALGGLR
jgi:hypothetical protein